MISWQKPSFEDLAMNAEIGGYQPDDGGGERDDTPFAFEERSFVTGTSVADLVAAFLDGRLANEITAQHG